jgi:signal peptidase I
VTRLFHWKSLASLALQVAVLFALIAAFFVRTPQVSGLSMEPRITSGEIVLINTAAYRFGAQARGDIVAFHHDGDAPEVYIKRIIGIPGDRVRIDRGVVSVDGRRLDEPYVRFPDDRSFPEQTVPPDSLYVLGDNRANSDDSRFWGFVRNDQVLGKALAGIWPLGHAGAL